MNDMGDMNSARDKVGCDLNCLTPKKYPKGQSTDIMNIHIELLDQETMQGVQPDEQRLHSWEVNIAARSSGR